jgi:WhiB family redox-sensing transcriptional regulator
VNGYEPLPWMGAANCATTGGDAFFPEKGDSAIPAKRICGACDVVAECLQFAQVARIRHGVFGGLTERQRNRIRNPHEADENAA